MGEENETIEVHPDDIILMMCGIDGKTVNPLVYRKAHANVVEVSDCDSLKEYLESAMERGRTLNEVKGTLEVGGEMVHRMVKLLFGLNSWPVRKRREKTWML